MSCIILSVYVCVSCSLCVYGGGDRRQQIQGINKGVEIIIGEAGLLYMLYMCLYNVFCCVSHTPLSHHSHSGSAERPAHERFSHSQDGHLSCQFRRRSMHVYALLVVIRFTFGSRPSYSVHVSITHRKQCVIKTCTERGRPGTDAKLEYSSSTDEYSSVFFEALSALSLHCLAMLSPLASLSACWCTRFWMRLTACWTWGSSLRSERSCWTYDQTDRQS